MTSWLPVDDAWGAEGFASTGLVGYSRMRPWGFDAADFNLYDARALFAQLHNGYSSGAAFSASGASDPNGCAWSMWRRPMPASVDVKLGWQASMVSGVAADGSFRIAGLAARVDPGSPIGPETTQLFDSVSGYFWCYLHFPVQAWQHRLFRINAGVITYLAQLVEAPPLQQSPGSGGSWLPAPRRWRMVVEDEGSDVRIRCYQYNLGLQTPEELIFDHLDASGAKITDPGYCGFGLQTPRLYAGNLRPLVTAQYFGASNPGGLLIFADQWHRPVPATSQPTQDLYGTLGDDLAHLWMGDQRGRTSGATPFAGLLVKETGTPLNGLRLGGPIGFSPAVQAWGFHLSQRVADDQVKQHRRLEFQFSTGDTAEDREIGIFLRGTISQALPQYADTEAGREGYLATLRYDGTAAEFAARLYHYREGARALIASADLDAHGLTLGNVASLSVEGLNHAAGATPGSGTPAFSMKVNGIDVTTWAGSVAELAILDSRWVLDRRAAATKLGSIEGWYFKGSKATASPLAWAMGWSQLAFSEEPPPPSDLQSSIEVPSETAGKFGRLRSRLSWSVRTHYVPATVDHTGETSHRQRIRRLSRARRRWDVHSQHLTAAEASSLRAFASAHRGKEIPFDWTPPTGPKPDAVHFLDAQIVPRKIGHDTFEVTFRMEELFGDADPSFNVLLYILDDLAHEQFAIYDDVNGWDAGYPYASMPKLAQLASEGWRFRGAWNNPISSAHRACVLTGQRSPRTRIGSNFTLANGIQWTLADVDHVAISDLGGGIEGEILTFATGKWHLNRTQDLEPGAPRTDGRFREYYGRQGTPNEGTLDGVSQTWRHFEYVTIDAEGQVTTTAVRGGPGGVDAPRLLHVDEHLAVRAWLADIANSAQARFVLRAIHYPHGPFTLENGAWIEPGEFVAPHTGGAYHTMGASSGYTTGPGGGPEVRETIKQMLECADTMIAGELAQLSADELKNTVVIVCTDNGTDRHALAPAHSPSSATWNSAGNYVVEHMKGSLYEGGCGMPFVVWGGENTGLGSGVSDALVEAVDIYATVVDALGYAVPAGVDGRSLLPLMRGEVSHVRDYQFAQWHHQEGTRRGSQLLRFSALKNADGYKLMDMFAPPGVGGGTRVEMYHLPTDPFEKTDLMPQVGSDQDVTAAYNDLRAELDRILDEYTLRAIVRDTAGASSLFALKDGGLPLVDSAGTEGRVAVEGMSEVTIVDSLGTAGTLELV